MELTEKDRTPPKAAQEAAQKVLDWREEHGDEVKGMTDVGWRRARQIASGDPLSLETIKKISQFSRHEKNSTIAEEFKGEPWKDRGYVAWLGWGGDTAIKTWSKQIVDKSEKKNAKRHPEIYYCRHMYAGLAGYEDETILIELDAMRRMAKSFDGCPVYVLHQDVDLDTIEQADGWVASCWYNEDDGWVWAKFIAVTDAARDAIDKGWSVSNAYIPKQWGDGGTYTNIPYNRQVLDGDFTHLAIVPDPRYESAAIYDVASYGSYMEDLKAKRELKNSKGKKPMFKIFKNEKKEVTELDDLDGAVIELQNGESVSVEDMIKAVENAQKNESDKGKEDEKVNMDMEIEVGNETMPLKELVNKYKNMCKENEKAEEDAKKNMDEDKKAKENESDDDKKENEEDDEMKNAKSESYYEQLKNAHNSSNVKFETSLDMLERGKSRYGSAK